MVECEECRKKLGFLKGFRHPTMGKKHLLCSPCFDQVSESVRQWGEFVRLNALPVKPSDNNLHVDLKDISPNIPQIPTICDNFGVEKGIYSER